MMTKETRNVLSGNTVNVTLLKMSKLWTLFVSDESRQKFLPISKVLLITLI